MKKIYYPILGLGILYLLLSEKKVGKMIRKEDIEKIKSFGKRTYGLSFDKPTLIGIRGALPDENGKLILNGNEINLWNDSLVVITKDNSYFFQGTVDPGRYYMDNPMNSLGTARIEPGLYEMANGFHGLTTHGKKYPAFVPYKDLLVRRDGNKDKVFDRNDKTYKGKFGVNIHAMFSDGEVERNSAGCTVVKAKWGSPTWKQFYNLLSPSAPFKYMVVDGKELT